MNKSTTLYPFGARTSLPSATKYAKKLGVFMAVTGNELKFFMNEDAFNAGDNADLIYTITDNKGLYFKACSLAPEVKEELPQWVSNASFLKSLIHFLADNK